MGSASWTQEFQGLEIPVGCGGRPHLLRLEHGALRALSHPDTDRKELGLARVAGHRCECLAAIDKWDRGDDSQATLPEPLRPAARARAVASLDDDSCIRRDGSQLRSIAGEELRHLGAAARAVTGEDRAETIVVVSLTVAGEPMLIGTASAEQVHISASLPVTWWRSVWRRAPGTVDGRFYTRYDGDERLYYVSWEPASASQTRAVLREHVLVQR